MVSDDDFAIERPSLVLSVSDTVLKFDGLIGRVYGSPIDNVEVCGNYVLIAHQYFSPLTTLVVLRLKEAANWAIYAKYSTWDLSVPMDHCDMLVRNSTVELPGIERVFRASCRNLLRAVLAGTCPVVGLNVNTDFTYRTARSLERFIESKPIGLVSSRVYEFVCDHYRRA